MKNALKLHHHLLINSLTLSVAESLTSGLLQDVIGSNSGASKFFKGGLTAYTLEQKVELLGVDENHAAKVDCVSEQVAKEMAIGARQLFNSKVGIATTGYAGTYEEMGIKIPFAYVAVSYQGNVHVIRVEASEAMSRNEVRRLVTNKAIDLALECTK